MMLIEVLTRCYKRPSMLAVNQASLDVQTDSDWQQTMLIDDVGKGVEWANRNLGAYGPHLEGDYIWVLDDDDECTRPALFAEVRGIVAVHNPDVIMVRGDVGNEILPDDRWWGKPPQKYQIGMSNFIVRRDLWQTHASAFPRALCADYIFISAVCATTNNIHWHDVLAYRTQRVSRGKPE